MLLLKNGFVPSWLTRGRASLLQKDKSKHIVAKSKDKSKGSVIIDL